MPRSEIPAAKGLITPAAI
jgi:hypothetical protein